MKRLSDAIDSGGGRGFDTLRLAAAFGVLVSHAFSLTALVPGEPEPLARLTGGRWSIGAVCVAVFFAVSGFLIAQSADRNRSPFIFAEKRFLRIFPALIANTFVTALVLGPLVTRVPVRAYFRSGNVYSFLKGSFLLPHTPLLPGVFLSNPLRITVNGSLWTLHFELLCYLLIALLVYVLGLRSALPYLLLTSALTIAEALLRVPVTSLLHLAAVFLAGSCLYWGRYVVRVGRWAGLLGAFGFALSLMSPRLSPFGAIGLAYAAVCAGYCLPGWKLLHHRDYSYGLYLWAFPVQQALVQAMLGKPSLLLPWTNMLLATPIALGLAVLSWHFVEKPAKAVKLQLSSRSVFGIQRSRTVATDVPRLRADEPTATLNR